MFTVIPVIGFRYYAAYHASSVSFPIGWVTKINKTDKYTCFFCDGHKKASAQILKLTDALNWVKGKH